jgi:predicted Zn-dependent protease
MGFGGFVGWQRFRDHADRREALRSAERGDFSTAEPMLKRVIERHPDDGAVARALALGYLSADRLVEAEPYFERWCAARPGDPEPYTQRIGLWLRWSRLENVVDDARRVVELEPDNRKLRQQLPRWLLILGRFPEAEQECRRFLSTWPGDPWVLLIQAMLDQRQGRQAAATAIVDKLVRDYTDFPEAYLLRGTLYLDADQPDEAIPWLKRAAGTTGPPRREALYELSLALARTGRTEEAERVMAEARLLQEQEHLRELVRASKNERPDSIQVQVRLAEETLNAGQSERGLRLLADVLRQDPKCAAAHRVLAAYYDKHGQPERAAEHRRLESTP